MALTLKFSVSPGMHGACLKAPIDQRFPSGSMKNIAKDQFLALTVAVPQYAEQVRIADAVTDWDNATENLRRQTKLLADEKLALASHFLSGNHDIPPMVVKAAR
jgi:hypothetical protein